MLVACLVVRAGQDGLEVLVAREAPCPFPCGPVRDGEAPEGAAVRVLAELGLEDATPAPCGWQAVPGGAPLALTALRAPLGLDAPRDWAWSTLEDGPWASAVARASRALPGRRPVCAVVGCRETSERFTEEVRAGALAVGAEAARAGWTVLTGGLGGVMELAAHGAREAGGLTVGILPGDDPAAANPSVEVVLPSGIGYARNYLTALGGDVMVALPGGRGTLEEICFALDFGRPVLSWGSWRLEGAEWLDPADPTGLRRWLRRRLADFYRGSPRAPAPPDPIRLEEPRRT